MEPDRVVADRDYERHSSNLHRINNSHYPVGLLVSKTTTEISEQSRAVEQILTQQKYKTRISQRCAAKNTDVYLNTMSVLVAANSGTNQRAYNQEHANT